MRDDAAGLDESGKCSLSKPMRNHWVGTKGQVAEGDVGEHGLGSSRAELINRGRALFGR